MTMNSMRGANPRPLRSTNLPVELKAKINSMDQEVFEVAEFREMVGSRKQFEAALRKAKYWEISESAQVVWLILEVLVVVFALGIAAGHSI